MVAEETLEPARPVQVKLKTAESDASQPHWYHHPFISINTNI